MRSEGGSKGEKAKKSRTETGGIGSRVIVIYS
jgi:hypothetical protein